jgi:16S rRNA (cytidine1402-2'-O)-methyltransferase
VVLIFQTLKLTRRFMQGELYMVATPIGNLSDLSPRAKDVLSSVAVVFAEDTRVAKRLLSAFDINTKIKRYDHHSHEKNVGVALSDLEKGDIAYVSDAGTPGIEDPGGRLVDAVVKAGYDVIPIPGPSALMSALSASGFRAERFRVEGFPPKKKGRQTYFNEIAEIEGTVVIYESVHRIEKTLTELSKRQPERNAVIVRELTKKFEEIRRGPLSLLAKKISTSKLKGEYMIVLE